MKLIIDDEMVKRAEVAHYDAQCRGISRIAAMRAALSDALNPPPVKERTDDELCAAVKGCKPHGMIEVTSSELARLRKMTMPPEPEIKVTLEMRIAGQDLALEARNKGACRNADLWVLVKDIYRAMRKLEPKA